MDDIFMSVVFKDNTEATELLIRTILDRDDLFVIEAHTQEVIGSFTGRSICLDIFAKDSAGTIYDIEVQRSKDGASPRRLRYYSAVMDIDAIKRGSDFDKLPEKYIIFITEDDYFKKGKPIYAFANILIDDDLKMKMDDGQHYLYVNGANTEDTPLGNLMHDFRETDPDNMKYEILSDKVKYYKNDKEGEKIMGNVMEELRAEGRVEGRKEGHAEGRTEGRSEGIIESIKALAKYLKETSTKVEAIKQLVAVFGISEAEAKEALAMA